MENSNPSSVSQNFEGNFSLSVLYNILQPVKFSIEWYIIVVVVILIMIDKGFVTIGIGQCLYRKG